MKETELKVLRSIAVDFAHYISLTNQGNCSHEKHKEIFDDWYKDKRVEEITLGELIEQPKVDEKNGPWFSVMKQSMGYYPVLKHNGETFSLCYRNTQEEAEQDLARFKAYIESISVSPKSESVTGDKEEMMEKAKDNVAKKTGRKNWMEMMDDYSDNGRHSHSIIIMNLRLSEVFSEYQRLLGEVNK